ncbi:hypothetical protein AMECASPLE_037434 [Ameca splendens]|uniref:Murine leukemia virus integrase C-terminal domain-containing protein n=1 Tax=Ameca splendens TaxID=208324 RepID=A0ABV0Y887_9TELE
MCQRGNMLHLNDLRPGDQVLIKTLHRKDWSTPRWKGPFQVLLTTQRDHPGSIKATVSQFCRYRSQINRRGSRGSPGTKELEDP